MKKTLNIAMIGGGFMGRAHSNAWMKVTKFFDLPYDVNLKVVAGDKNRLEKFADNWGFEEVSYDWRETVKRDDIDIVDIVTPTYMHAQMAIEAAKNGKHIICEKPCALTYDECMEMAKAAKEAGVVSYLNHNYRRVPAVAFAKQLVEDGRLGDILSWHGQYFQDWLLNPDMPCGWQMQNEYAGGGALYDLGSHSVDLARFLVGEPVSVTSLHRTFIEERPLPNKEGKGVVDVDDAAYMLLEFEGKTVGSIEVSRFACGNKNANSFAVYGTKGAIRFQFQRMNELEFLDYTQPVSEQGYRTILCTEYDHPYLKAWWPSGHIIGFEHTFVNAFADVFSAIHDGAEITPNFEDGASIIRVLEASKKSAKENRRVFVNEII